MRESVRRAADCAICLWHVLWSWSECISAIALVGLAVAPSVVAAQAVALVVDRVGSVVVTRPSGTSPVQLLMAMPLGAKFHLSIDGQLKLLYLQSGDEYTLTGPGDGELRGEAPAFETSRMQRLSGKSTGPLKLQLDNVAFAGVVMRGGAFTPRYPAGVVTERPIKVGWNTLLENARFRVEIRDEQGQLLWHDDIVGTTAPFPRGILFEPGERYEWTVRFADFEGPVSGITFEWAQPDIRSLAARLKPTDTATFSQRTTYALWLEHVGAVGEARQAWNVLAQERPSENVLVTRALR